MAYKPIEIDRENIKIMGVKFSDLDTLNSAANAIGSNMFEGFEPTVKSLKLLVIIFQKKSLEKKKKIQEINLMFNNY
jgi:hypothetical protein